VALPLDARQPGGVTQGSKKAGVKRLKTMKSPSWSIDILSTIQELIPLVFTVFAVSGQ
jgi:hypothetical protein